MQSPYLIQESFSTTIARKAELYELLKAATGTTHGVWIPAALFQNIKLEITGTFNATLKAYGTHKMDPGDSDDGIQIGSDITAAGFVAITGPYNFIRVGVTAFTSGSINCKALLGM